MIIKNITNQYLIESEENQYFDRKSARIKPADILRHIVAFANANGGVLAIGIEDNGEITGFDGMNAHKVNEFLEAPYLVDGNVKINYEERVIKNKKVLLFEIEPSENYVIKTKDSKVYLRVGDKSKLLNHEQIIQLEYDKGERRFEDLVVEESTFEDVDIKLLSKYKEILNTNLSLEEILEARALMKKGHLTYAGILLFGKFPTKYLPNARVRLLKFEGNRMENNELPACPVETTLTLIGNKWKVLILRDLMPGSKRFGKLQRSIGQISQKVLTSNLKEMETKGIVHRKVYAEVPPRVEYSLTDLVKSLKPIIDSMWNWGENYKRTIQ